MAMNGENDSSSNNGFHKELETLAQKLRDSELKIKELENELKKVRTETNELQQSTIPDFMFEHNLTAVTLSNGSRIDVKPYYYIRLPKNGKGEVDKDKANKLYEWMDKNGFGGLVKSHFEVWTTDPQIIEMLRIFCSEDEPTIPYELSRGVHWKTLESWFKEQTEAQVSLPTDLFDSFIGRRAYLK